MKRIFLSSPTIHDKEKEYIKEAFDTNWVAPLGPNVDSFEKELAEYVGAAHAAALSSGTAAIHMALKAAGIKKGDIVFASALTFAATCNPILYVGGVPIFIDSEAETWNMSPEALERAFEIYPQTKAVIVVNLYGTPAKLERIKNICKRHNAVLIEDAAESLGGTYEDKQTGTFGDFGVYSFNGNKIITTSGGGMLVSNDENKIKKVRFWATQAREPKRHYEHKELGYNYRMSNVLAGIGRGQLLALNEHIRLKQEIYNEYKTAFADISEISMNPYLDCSKPNFWLSCMLISADSKVKPLDIILALEKYNIESRPIWKPMQLQPLYKKCDFVSCEKDSSSVSEDIYNRGVCLPSDIKNTKEDMEMIIHIIRDLF